MTALETGTLTGWHFAADKLRDGRPLPGRGERLLHKGECVPCEKGLHFSERVIDALEFAPGSFVARVLGPADAIDHEGNKRCGSWREGLTNYVDATRVLHEFACWCATQALDAQEARGYKADPRSRAAIEVKLAWLDGRATDVELAAARAAACDAARAAQNTELERRLTELIGGR